MCKSVPECAQVCPSVPERGLAPALAVCLTAGKEGSEQGSAQDKAQICAQQCQGSMPSPGIPALHSP